MILEKKKKELKRLIGSSVPYFDFRFQEKCHNIRHNEPFDEIPKAVYFCPCQSKYVGRIKFAAQKCLIHPFKSEKELLQHLGNKKCLLHGALAVYLKSLYAYDLEEKGKKLVRN